MPVWGRRESYVAVTVVVSSLAVIGVVSRCNRQFIPPPEPNDLAGFEAPFLKRAGNQDVEWRTTDVTPFAEARRLDLPVMVVAGSSSGLAARRFDDVVFSHPEVAARLNRDFISVRVDYIVEPEWRAAFLPIRRDRDSSDTSYAIWFFNPDGTLITWSARRTWDGFPDQNDFLGILGEVSALRRSTPQGEPTAAEAEQRREREALRGGGSVAVPDVQGFLDAWDLPREFFQWQAARYRVLLQSALGDELQAVLERDLATPRVDLVDGGFFRLGSWSEPSLVEFDKIATANADMAAVLARASPSNPIFQYWYGRTMDGIAEQFMSGALWSSYVEVEADPDGRSPRNSFGVATVRTKFDADAREFAPVLGLDVGTNPLMAPFLKDPKRALGARKRLDRTVDKLREIGSLVALTPAEDDTLDSAGFVVARCIEAAAFLDDQPRLQRALRWAGELERFRAGTDDVLHSTHGRALGRRWLGDYTAYSDAMLEAFAATGDEKFLTQGEAVLRRALELFTRDEPGDVVSTTRSHPLSDVLDLQMPSLVDDGRPPAVPWLMALCFRYGAVLGDKPLRERAVQIAQRFSPVANSSPTSFPTFFALAQESMFTGCVVVPEGSGLVDAYRWFSSQPGVRAFPAAAANAESEGSVLQYLKAGFTGMEGRAPARP